MSALTWDEVGVVESTPRRHLTLVPTGDEVAGGGLQLTRRGRLALTLVVLALAVIAAVVGVNRAFAAPAAAAPLATVTVASGDTLSAIAAREMPGLPIRRRPSSASRSPTTSTPPPSAPARASSSRLLGPSTRLSSAAELLDPVLQRRAPPSVATVAPLIHGRRSAAQWPRRRHRARVR